jgi:thiosulfate oxidation carrier complex protein SoxZ
MDTTRRHFIELATTSLGWCFAPGIYAQTVHAAPPPSAFKVESLAEAMKVAGVRTPAASDDFLIEAPELAENPTIVPLVLASRIPNTASLAVFIDRNPFPFVAWMHICDAGIAYLGLRTRFAESSILRVVVVTRDGRQYMATRSVRTAGGGCATENDLVPSYPDPPPPSRIRATFSETALELRALLFHPMENGLRRRSNGTPIAARHIERVDIRLQDRHALELHLGPSVSTNPLIGLRLAGARANDTLELSWRDTHGATRMDRMTLTG